MSKACLVVSAPYGKGEIFNKANEALNRDNNVEVFHLLKDYFAEKNFDLNTQDLNKPDDCDLVIYNEMPVIAPKKHDVDKSYLLLFESELIRPDNWNLKAHENFSKIFTWHDEFVDNKKYFKMNFGLSGCVSFVAFRDKKFCTLMAGNKDVAHKLELYSERKRAIRWFEKNHPEDFEFYGTNWDRYIFRGPLWIHALNTIPGLGKSLA